MSTRKDMTINSYPPGQNGRHFGRRRFQMRFMDDKIRILIRFFAEVRS